MDETDFDGSAFRGLRSSDDPNIVVTLMMLRLFIFVFALVGIGFIRAQDNIDPDMQEQINAAKKQAEKMGVKMPDIEKMMQESAAEDDAAAKTEAAKKAPATKPEPLAALPAWVPAIDGFQLTAGSGKHWIDNEGKEQGTMKGTVAGDPHAVFKKWEQSAKPQFSGPDTSWSPTIGSVNGKHYVSLHTFRRDASGTAFCDLTLELDAAGGGKSTVTISYIQPTGGCGEKK